MCNVVLHALVMTAVVASSCSSAPAPPAPPAADASISARRRAPEFLSGDECLFCHREKVGAGWAGNLHNRTVHDIGVVAREGVPAPAEFALGAREVKYWLRTTADYGVLAIRTAAGAWDEEVFATSCAGCHASGVHPETGAFVAVSLDCFVCHGDVTLEHTNDPGRALLSPRREVDPLVVTSICGQCHLRGGRSRSTGRAWPSGFIAGDALFDDFEFDFSDGALTALSVADRHVAENVRDVALEGRTGVTCLSCHSIHGESSQAHRQVEETDLCFTCHVRGERRSQRPAFTTSNSVCDMDRGS